MASPALSMHRRTVWSEESISSFFELKDLAYCHEFNPGPGIKRLLLVLL
jgi:hypothetical protein